MKTCRKCGETKPLNAFYDHKGSKDGKAYRCKPCAHETTREWRRRSIDKAKGREKRYHLRTLYGLEYEEYERLLAHHSGRCAICGEAGGARGLGVDHCHSSGRIRGLLCGRCNKGLGLFRDKPELLERAITYLAEQADTALRDGD